MRSLPLKCEFKNGFSFHIFCIINNIKKINKNKIINLGARKRVKTPQKGSNRARMKFSCFSGGDTLKLWAQTKFEAKPVEIAPFRTKRTVGPQNGPYPKLLFSDGNWKFVRCQSGDIFQTANRQGAESQNCNIAQPT